MAATIPIARLKSDPSKAIKAAEYKPEDHRGDIRCPDKRCCCDLQGVQAGNRTVNGEVVAVAAFFRLPGNAEKTGKGHKPSCRYNIDCTVKRLVARSKEIINLDPAALPLLAATRGQPAEFRIHILMEVLPSLRSGWNENASDALAGPKARIGTNYVRSNRYRPSYLRVAKAVLSFIARIQDRPSLDACIRLQYGALTLAWEEYFYDTGEYSALFHYLTAHRQFRRNPGRDRPIAIAVEIASPEIKQTKFGDWQVRGRAAVCPVDGKKAFAVRPMLYVADEALARRIASERHILVCGVPTLGSLREPNRPGLKPCADVSIDIINRAQVCQYFPTLNR